MPHGASAAPSAAAAHPSRSLRAEPAETDESRHGHAQLAMQLQAVEQARAERPAAVSHPCWDRTSLLPRVAQRMEQRMERLEARMLESMQKLTHSVALTRATRV